MTMSSDETPLCVGWREWISLPDLGIETLKAKVDTGARTSALHAIQQEPFEKGGQHWVAFKVPLVEPNKEISCQARLVDERDIKNTSGKPETRYVVSTKLVFGPKAWTIEVSLADRANMEFDIILGRTALREHGLLVDAGKSFLMGPPRHT